LTQGDLSHTRPSRAVVSLTEGDLIIGRKNLSAIGTLVERTSNYTMLLHLPDGYTPELVRDALAAKIKTLPEVLRASLTWDQGPEMGKWKQVSVDADIDIFFCDPHAPWQRATNENTNGLLRQYFPTYIRTAMAWSGQLPVASRRTPGGLTRVLSAALAGSPWVCRPPGARSRLDSTEA
jgi:IS30 family transposase